MRNSDPDAALYWLGRMLEAGEDPLYIARRVVRMAVEDIGLADPNALSCAWRLAMRWTSSACRKETSRWRKRWYICRSRQNRMRFTPHMATCSRTSSSTARRTRPAAFAQRAHAADEGWVTVRDISTRTTWKTKVADMQCLPDNLRDREYYRPTNEGIEKRIRERMEEVKRQRSRSEEVRPPQQKKES